MLVPKFTVRPLFVRVKPKHEDVPPDVSQLKALEDQIFLKKIDDNDLLYSLFQGTPWEEAVALLSEELKEVPFSPISMQLKALVRVEANREARDIISKLDSE